MDYIREIEKNLGMEAKLNLMPMQDGDVRKSHADVEDLIRDFDYAPKWNIKDGIKNFIQWYADYYKVKLPTHWAENDPTIISTQSFHDQAPTNIFPC